MRSKNSINVAIKNLVDFCIACFLFWLLGFPRMFGDSILGLVGSQVPPTLTWSGQDYAFFLFQLAFCGTATTIVSGAVAERMSFLGYFIAAIILSALIYPITGHWAWGGLWFDGAPGWLRSLQFHDFAGATVVHSVGAWMAFAAIIIIGPRLGRFHPSPKAIDGHNLPIAVLGVFLLWFGWFGFNGGSTFAFNETVPKILVNTAQGGATGGLMALLTTWVLHPHPRVPLIMNGVIGGLVSVTAGCDLMTPLGASWAGGIGGILCTLSANSLARYRIDDAVGVVPAHLVCGLWGTMAVALFSDPSLWATEYNVWQKLGVQFLGASTIGVYAFAVSYGLLWLINRVYPLRVTEKEERMGLNISEHGASTAVQELLACMNTHSLVGDFTQPVIVEPETDVTLIAKHYNRVLEKMSKIQGDLRESRERLLTILNSPAFPVVISQSQGGRIQFLNERAAELFGFTLQEAGSYEEVDFWHRQRDRAEFLRAIRSKGRVSNFEACLTKVDNTQFWTLISGLELEYNQQQCILFSFSDISTQINREGVLRKLATTDALTGIYNRRFFFDLTEQVMSNATQEEQALSLLILDIDHFKYINDTYGHAQGDRVIQHVTEVCTTILREGDLLGRIGGEEFAILLRSPLKTALFVAERLRQRLEDSSLTSSSDLIYCTVSIGVTAIQPDDTLEMALERADTALYEAKEQGRNQVKQYSSASVS